MHGLGKQRYVCAAVAYCWCLHYCRVCGAFAQEGRAHAHWQVSRDGAGRMHGDVGVCVSESGPLIWCAAPGVGGLLMGKIEYSLPDPTSLVMVVELYWVGWL